MDESLVKSYLQDRFKNLKSKKILVYGTGIVASRLLKALADFSIVGVMDRVLVEGKFCEIPILTWEDIDDDTADILIIAATKKNYRIIFERIQYICFALNIIIYGENGKNLTNKYQMKYIDNSQFEYFQKKATDLKEVIDKYDAVSFDLFDTLIMRKTLNPTDIFDLVEKRIRKKGIFIEKFKKKRQTAGLQSKNGKIDQIYDNLRSRIKLTKEESMFIMQEELQCEKEYLIPREAMVDIMNYAVRQGKTVSIISDMHIPAHSIESMLCDMGIKGYHKLYVSCEYGVGKVNGLFQVYLQEVGSRKCLHIGDNLYADVIVPRRYGIDSYEIKSAYEMLNISSLRRILICSGRSGCNMALGLMLSELFNDPFALYDTMGFVEIRRVDIFARLFIAPLVFIYMQNLVKIVKSKNYDSILFSARDGYLFKKIYDLLFLDKCKTTSVYFLTSRKLCLSTSLDSSKKILDLCMLFSTQQGLQLFIDEMLGCEHDTEVKTEDPVNIQEYLLSFGDRLKEKSIVIKENYKKYFEKMNIDSKKKYLFCDLNSRGTIQEILNETFVMDLDGFYLCRKQSLKKTNINVTSVYDEQWGNDFSDAVDLLETILTSENPSIFTMDETGNPIYAEEKRTKQELEMVKKAHQAIIEYMQQCIELKMDEENIDARFPEMMLELFDSVKYVEELKVLRRLRHIDDLSQTSTYILCE